MFRYIPVDNSNRPQSLRTTYTTYAGGVVTVHGVKTKTYKTRVAAANFKMYNGGNRIVNKYSNVVIHFGRVLLYRGI